MRYSHFAEQMFDDEFLFFSKPTRRQFVDYDPTVLVPTRTSGDFYYHDEIMTEALPSDSVEPLHFDDETSSFEATSRSLQPDMSHFESPHPQNIPHLRQTTRSLRDIIQSYSSTSTSFDKSDPENRENCGGARKKDNLPFAHHTCTISPPFQPKDLDQYRYSPSKRLKK